MRGRTGQRRALTAVVPAAGQLVALRRLAVRDGQPEVVADPAPERRRELASLHLLDGRLGQAERDWDVSLLALRRGRLGDLVHLFLLFHVHVSGDVLDDDPRTEACADLG